jgi:ABC-type multidrug transport system ATPase subunit
MTDSIIELDGIGVRLGGRQILSDVSFGVRPGEFTGLIGPNGAGKTTLLRVILGLLQPTSGTSRRSWSSTRTCRCAPGMWSPWVSTGTS